MPINSQIANFSSSVEIRNPGNASVVGLSHNANMDDDSDIKNGGPNHLGAWLIFRGRKSNHLADELGISASMMSDLINSKRALSAKWLRRIAPALKTTPGMLLDHDPRNLDSDLIEIWVESSLEQRKTLADVARAVVHRAEHDKKDGTKG